MTHIAQSLPRALRRLPAPPVPRAALAWCCGAALLLGCAGTLRTDSFRGACASTQAECRSTCAEVKDEQQAEQCLLDCDVEARSCAARVGEDRTIEISGNVEPVKGVADLAAAPEQRIVFAHGLIDSNGPAVQATGAARATETAEEVMPGGSVRMTFNLPPGTRDATLEVEHGSGFADGACYITVSLGDKAFLARYVAPRRALDGKLHVEKWEIGSHLPTSSEQGAPLTLFIYNNAEAGSRSPYFLHSVRLNARSTGK